MGTPTYTARNGNARVGRGNQQRGDAVRERAQLGLAAGAQLGHRDRLDQPAADRRQPNDLRPARSAVSEGFQVWFDNSGTVHVNVRHTATG